MRGGDGGGREGLAGRGGGRGIEGSDGGDWFDDFLRVFIIRCFDGICLYKILRFIYELEMVVTIYHLVVSR